MWLHNVAKVESLSLESVSHLGVDHGWSGGGGVTGSASHIRGILPICRLHLVGHQVMLWDAVGVSHRCVVLIQAPDSVHFIVDAAGDVLYVLHVGPARNEG